MTDKKELRGPAHGDQGWWVHWAGSDQPITVSNTQLEAIDKGRKLAISNRAELVIEGMNGEIDERRDYANYQPRGA